MSLALLAVLASPREHVNTMSKSDRRVLRALDTATGSTTTFPQYPACPGECGTNASTAIASCGMQLCTASDGIPAQLIPTDSGECEIVCLTGSSDGSKQCPHVAAGKMWFMNGNSGCRVASGDITYVDINTEIQYARAHEVIHPLNEPGEAVYYPPPPRTDCYFYQDACGPEEFCMVQMHEKWGPWAATPQGLPANTDCNDALFSFTEADLTNAEPLQVEALEESILTDYCGGVVPDSGYTSSMNAVGPGGAGSGGGPFPSPWKPAQGVCVKYRDAQQSCKPSLKGSGNFYSDSFIALADATKTSTPSLDRPLTCGPGLVCTGDDAALPSTCVARPPEGGEGNAFSGGIQIGARLEQQSCSDSHPCAEGLTCTGADFEVLPHTCVEARPRDVCFAGPWWDSSRCPRTSVDAPCGGISAAMAHEALLSALLLAPGEVVYPGRCGYWTGPSAGWNERLDRVRRQIYDVFAALWPAPNPARGLAPMPPFASLEASFYLGTSPANRTTRVTAGECNDASMAEFSTPNGLPSGCVIESGECLCGGDACGPAGGSTECETCRIKAALANAAQRASRPALVWSLVHWTMHNLPRTLTREQVEASKAIALILKDLFWCNDCRGFFAIGVLGSVGYPPDSTRREDHARYWNMGHNIASEHVATTRGGHPWIFQLANQSAGPFTGEAYQNPFFMPYEAAVRQWTQCVPAEEGAGSSRRKVLFGSVPPPTPAGCPC